MERTYLLVKGAVFEPDWGKVLVNGKAITKAEQRELLAFLLYNDSPNNISEAFVDALESTSMWIRNVCAVIERRTGKDVADIVREMLEEELGV